MINAHIHVLVHTHIHTYTSSSSLITTITTITTMTQRTTRAMLFIYKAALSVINPHIWKILQCVEGSTWSNNSSCRRETGCLKTHLVPNFGDVNV